MLIEPGQFQGLGALLLEIVIDPGHGQSDENAEQNRTDGSGDTELEAENPSGQDDRPGIDGRVAPLPLEKLCTFPRQLFSFPLENQKLALLSQGAGSRNCSDIGLVFA